MARAILGGSVRPFQEDWGRDIDNDITRSSCYTRGHSDTCGPPCRVKFRTL